MSVFSRSYCEQKTCLAACWLATSPGAIFPGQTVIRVGNADPVNYDYLKSLPRSNGANDGRCVVRNASESSVTPGGGCWKSRRSSLGTTKMPIGCDTAATTSRR